MTDRVENDGASAYEIADQVIRGLTRHAGSYSKVSDLAAAYRVAANVDPERGEQ